MADYEILTEIEVRKPQNTMSALYEIVAPPIVTEVLNPIKDSFTRQGNGFDTINYGTSNSLVVGRINEIYRAFLQFDFSSLSSQYILIDSKLRLHYTGIFDETIQLEAYTVDRNWIETSITNSNRPNPKEFIIDKYTINKTAKYIEFDFLDIVNKWNKHQVNNDGLMIRIKNESDIKSANFRSRESTTPPELIINYYDTRVYSTGRSQVLTEIFVWSTGNSDILTEITVGSVVSNNELPTELYVHRVDTPVESDKLTEITVTRNSIPTVISAAIKQANDILTELEIRSAFINKGLDTEISVTRDKVLTELYVKERNSILTEIVVIGKPYNDILTNIAVSRDSILTEINVKYTSAIDTEISVVRSDSNDILTEISASRDGVLTEIGVKERNDIPTTIDVRGLEQNEILTEVTASRDSILTEITVMESSNIPVEIFVKYTDDILTELTVHHTSSILTEIDVMQKNDVITELTVSVPKILTSITVPFRDKNEILTMISPRVLNVSTIDTVITIKRIVGAYAFII